MNPYTYINMKKQPQPEAEQNSINRVLESPVGTLIGLTFVFFLACAVGVYALFAHKEIAEVQYDSQPGLAGARHRTPKVLGEKTSTLPQRQVPQKPK